MRFEDKGEKLWHTDRKTEKRSNYLAYGGVIDRAAEQSYLTERRGNNLSYSMVLERSDNSQAKGAE
jgi:hypothetical protein